MRSTEERNKLVTENLDLPRFVFCDLVKQGLYSVQVLGEDDAVAYGHIGLLKAAERWDPAHPSATGFRTFAQYWVRAAMFRAARYQLPIVRFTEKHPPMKRRSSCFLSECATRDGIADYEDREEVADLLRRLPKQYAEVLKMRYLDSMTQLEVAQIMNVTRQRVEQIEHIALRRLRGEGVCRRAS